MSGEAILSAENNVENLSPSQRFPDPLAGGDGVSAALPKNPTCGRPSD